MIQKIVEVLENPKRDCIYDILGYLDVCLCVDVGSAAGEITTKLCQVGGENTRVVAFEPFSGNYQHFFDATKDLPNEISLIEKAISDSVGTAIFVVPSVVQGSEPGWEKYVGYSSVGFLSSLDKLDSLGLTSPVSKVTKSLARLANRFVDLNSLGLTSLIPKVAKPFVRLVNRTLRGRLQLQVLEVETTTIDEEFSNETIDFMKIDVQGAEGKVLNGALRALSESRIDLLYIEWSGEEEVIDILCRCGYEIYDSMYLAGPKVYDFKPFEEIGFDLFKEKNLSTGKVAYEMVLSDESISPKDAIREVQKRGLGWIQTDLIAVSKHFREPFARACKHFSEGQAD